MKSRELLFITNDENILIKNYEVNSFLTNIQGCLSLYSLLNLLQDVAQHHANQLGFGYEQMLATKTFWVLTRQKLRMDEWPKSDETIQIKTCIRFGGASFTNRDFVIYKDGSKIGEATTTWMTLDGDTRRPKSVLETNQFENLSLPFTVNVQAEKIFPEAQDAQTTLAEFKVRNSDIDQNNHVNNTKYSQWVLDAVPFELHRDHQIQSYSINFLAETKLGDVVKIQKGPRQYSDESFFKTQFQGLRASDSKIMFLTEIEVKKI